jgi:Uma2 family endonuclease
MSVQFARNRRFTVDEFHRMAETGILSPDDRVELINGEIVEMTPVGPRHAACVRGIALWLHELLGREAIVSVQSPIAVGAAEPYPDAAVLRWREDLYRTVHPTPADTLVLIEVADSSVLYDRNVKSEMYARAGVPEFWLVDLTRNAVVVFSDPQGGRYVRVDDYTSGESWVSPGLGGREVKVEDVLGPE